MKVKVNIPDWLKIPLKILLPAVFIVSGSLVLLPKEVLSLLYLLEWRDRYGFYIGLSFLVSTSLIAVYILYHFKVIICSLWNRLFSKRRVLSQIGKMNEAERAVIFQLYHSDSYTAKLDFNQPIVKGLLQRAYIYTGSTQWVTANPYENCIPINCTLQPSVYEALVYSELKIQENMQKLEKRIQHTKKGQKREILQRKYEDLKKIYDIFYCQENSRWRS